MNAFNPLSIILNQNKLTGENFVDWKRNLYIVLTTEDYKFYLTQPYLEALESDAYRNQRRSYEKWPNAIYGHQYPMFSRHSTQLWRQLLRSWLDSNKCLGKALDQLNKLH